MSYKETVVASEADGLDLFVREWAPDSAVKATVQLLHGLAEHTERYGRFADALTSAGFRVIAHDQRGHGKSVPEDKSFGDAGEPGWVGLGDDAVQMLARTKSLYPDEPIILFGHSMGSFVAQTATINTETELAGLILSGSTDLAMVAQLVEATGEAPSFATYNAAFAPNRTEFDWLSRDNDEVDKYIADPMCGWDAPPEFAAGMVAGGKLLGDATELSKIQANLPILLVAGSADPLNGNLSLLQSLKARYEGLGLTVDTQFYDDGRHEMLNEINRDDVTKALINWMGGL